MPNTPIQVSVAGVAASLALPPAGETPQLPVGQIFSASVLPAPPGSPMGAVLLALDQGTTVLIRAAFPLQPGERVAAEAEAGGKGKGQILRLVAQSGRPLKGCRDCATETGAMHFGAVRDPPSACREARC